MKNILIGGEKKDFTVSPKATLLIPNSQMD